VYSLSLTSDRSNKYVHDSEKLVDHREEPLQ
jgi:hypothetical protein